ncbi:MAG TPA: DUF3419 family protein [Syntrophobacteria bacterium]|nr:DUF3419 family protein [Syntrophobacteria bacterium]
MSSEIGEKADFSIIRYAQCWEDADILLEALAIQPGHTCVAIASAGDNALAMLGAGPGRVIALDLSPAQVACLELRVAAFRELDHHELLELVGARPSGRRPGLYGRCRPLLRRDARDFWDHHAAGIEHGIGHAGRFERYLESFRSRLLPLIHPQTCVERLFQLESVEERESFYRASWDNRRWKLLFQLFFSRFVMARMGRDPSFFHYVEGSVSEHLLGRARYALTKLDPRENPYLQWILLGRFDTALPYWLRAENVAAIRRHLDRLEWRCQPLEEFLGTQDAASVDRFNLSDVFEYMSQDNYHQMLERLLVVGNRGGRLVYWNMLVPRRRPDRLAHRLRPLRDLAEDLHRRDKAFFYSALIVEEIL